MAAPAPSPAREALQREYNAVLESLKGLQADMQKLMQGRAQLMAQQSENEVVKDELDRLDEDANVFKLVGPALVKQDLIEAKSNVAKRLEFIRGELDRVDGQVKGLQGKMADKEKEILKIQKRAQATASS